ncbi:MAG: paraquat-inducible protein A [Gammaproteobacteria bacterium]
MLSRLARATYYLPAAVLVMLVVREAREADRLLGLAADMQSVDGTARMAWATVLEKLSFSWYSGATDLAEAYARLVEEARLASDLARNAAAALALLSLVHLGAIHWGARRRAVTAWHLNLVAVLLLATGILAPMLTVTAHSVVPVLGEVVLRHETKSIVSTVTDLVGHGSLLLGGAIALFSIALPAAKLALVMLVLQARAAPLRHRVAEFLHAVGKWSMADVFVVAVLLAYLAINKDQYSTAQVGLGLYFFAAYCVASMLAAQLAVGAELAPAAVSDA